MQRSQTVVREPYRDGRRTSWTGPGFTRVFENSYIEFDIDNIERSLDYDLVVRYEPQVRSADRLRGRQRCGRQLWPTRERRARLRVSAVTGKGWEGVCMSGAVARRCVRACP